MIGSFRIMNGNFFVRLIGKSEKSEKSVSPEGNRLKLVANWRVNRLRKWQIGTKQLKQKIK